MKQENIQDIFDFAGLTSLGEHLSYKLWVTGTIEDQDEEILDNFLNTFDFQNMRQILFDDFLFHYQVFRNVYHRNENLNGITY